MKKVISLILSLILMVSVFSGCAGENSTGSLRVAIVQQLDHISLDEIRIAIEAELEALAQEKGISIEYKVFNGHDDPSVLGQIGSQVVSEGYDAIIPIATTAAQYMVNAVDTAGLSIPIIFAAVSDPEQAGLTGFPYVTGTSDALNTAFILEMMLAVDPDIRSVGLLYSNSEINSEVPVAEAVAYLQEKGIAVVEKTGNTTDEIITAAAALVGQVDAVFTPTDNKVMAAEVAVAQLLNEAGIPHYTGADSFVYSGAFATCGVNYTELGRYTAQMAVEVLMNNPMPEIHVMDGGIITVNADTAAVLGLDYEVFRDKAGSVVEVTEE